MMMMMMIMIIIIIIIIIIMTGYKTLVRTSAKISRNNSRGKGHHIVESTSTNGQNYS